MSTRLRKNNGTYVSAENMPASYQIYRAILSQTGTSAPTAVVLENTLGGTVIWTRESAGYYRGTLTGKFLITKTFSKVNYDSQGTAQDVYGGRETDNYVSVNSLDLAGVNVDLVGSVSIEILVYA